MAGAENRTFDSPDEVRTPEKARIEVIDLGGTTVARATFQPGWRWSESVKPIVGGESCQATHLGVLVAGRMRVVHEDGTEIELSPGGAYRIQPGHDAWVVGDEAVVGFEFESRTAESFAKS